MKTEIQTIPTPPASAEASDPTILSMPVDPYYITSIDAVTSELQAHLDVGTPVTEGASMIIRQVRSLFEAMKARSDKKRLTDSVEDIVATINDLDQSSRDLIDAARFEADELRAIVSDDSGVTPGAIPFSRIDAELAHRATAFAEISHTQEQREDEAAAIRRDIRECEQILASGTSTNRPAVEKRKAGLEQRLRAVEHAIAELVSSSDDNRRTEDSLRKYRQAILIVRQGLPDDIFGKKLV